MVQVEALFVRLVVDCEGRKELICIKSMLSTSCCYTISNLYIQLVNHFSRGIFVS